MARPHANLKPHAVPKESFLCGFEYRSRCNCSALFALASPNGPGKNFDQGSREKKRTRQYAAKPAGQRPAKHRNGKKLSSTNRS